MKSVSDPNLSGLLFHGIQPFVRMDYDAFGRKQMMRGSNYLPVSMKENYANTLHYLVEHLSSFCNEADREWIIGKTAISLFKFHEK
jgi:predicted TIM-barrel fold metal-dependent hydrolase